VRVAVEKIHLLTLALVLFGVSGCTNECDAMCDAQGEMIGGCLAQWGTTWDELSYADQDAFVSRCYAIWGDALQDLDEDDPERAQLLRQCQTDTEVARSDTDCQSLVSINP
jgi:hypothetical protein